MSKNAKAISLHIANGNPNRLTKAEIKRREESEIKLGNDKVVCPMYVKTDTVAYKKWRDLIADYNKAKKNGIELIKSSDSGILAMYCKTFSEYQVLLKAHQRVSEIHYDCKELDEAIDGENEVGDALFSYKVKKQLRELFSIGGILAIETAINKKMDMLIKMEDRLFLNPLAKVKNIPKKPKEEEVDDPMAKLLSGG